MLYRSSDSQFALKALLFNSCSYQAELQLVHNIKNFKKCSNMLVCWGEGWVGIQSFGPHSSPLDDG